MKTQLEERIDKRTCIAEDRMQRQNDVERFFSKAGLATANQSDRFITWLGEERPMTVPGIARGALAGFALAFLAVAMFNLAAIGGFVIVGGALVGGVVQGLREGAEQPSEKLEAQLQRVVPDKIGQVSGALPTPLSHLTSGPEETLSETKRKPELLEDVIQQTQPERSFTCAEIVRRERQKELASQQMACSR